MVVGHEVSTDSFGNCSIRETLVIVPPGLSGDVVTMRKVYPRRIIQVLKDWVDEGPVDRWWLLEGRHRLDFAYDWLCFRRSVRGAIAEGSSCHFPTNCHACCPSQGPVVAEAVLTGCYAFVTYRTGSIAPEPAAAAIVAGNGEAA
jgi:hypothetical protein